MIKEIVDDIIKNLNRIPKKIETTVDIKKIANEVSRVLQRQTTGRFSQ